jgi:hypothetical protein
MDRRTEGRVSRAGAVKAALLGIIGRRLQVGCCHDDVSSHESGTIYTGRYL